MNNKQIVGSTVISYLTVAVQMIGTVLVTPYLIKSFGDNDYGIYKIVLSLSAYLMILNFGFGNSLIRFLSELRVRGTDRGNSGKWLVSFLALANLLSCLLAVSIGIILYIMIPYFFSESLSSSDLKLAQDIFVVLLVSSIFTILTDIFSSYLFVYDKIYYVKLIDLTKYTMRIFLVYLFVGADKRATAIAYIDLVISLFTFITVFAYAVHREKFPFSIKAFLYKDHIEVKGIMIYACLFFLNLIIEQLIWNTDSIIIGMRLKPFYVSIFSSGAIVSAAFNSMTQILSTIIFPKIVMMFAPGNADKDATSVIVKVSRIQAFIAMYIFGGYTVLGKYFVTRIWLNENYSLAWSTSVIVMLGTMFSSFLSSGHMILKAVNKQLVFLICEAVIFIINIFATYYLVIPFGINGAAYSTTISYLFGMFCVITPYLGKTLKLDIIKYYKGFLSIIIPMMILTFIAYMIINAVGIRNIGGMVLWGCIYSVCYCGLGVLLTNNDEKRMIRKVLGMGSN